MKSISEEKANSISQAPNSIMESNEDDPENKPSNSDLASEIESENLSDDEVFGDQNAEVSLCQLINETFKFSEDDDYFDSDW